MNNETPVGMNNDIRPQSLGDVPTSSAGRPPEKSALKIALSILAVLIVVWGLYVLLKNRDGLEWYPATDEGFGIKQEEQGVLNAEFPAELILEEGVSVRSYILTYEDIDVRQPVAEYRSSKTVAENIAQFKGFLASNGWTISKEATVDEAPTTNFYATKDTADVNITLTAVAEGTQVTITYLSR